MSEKLWGAEAIGAAINHNASRPITSYEKD